MSENNASVWSAVVCADLRDDDIPASAKKKNCFIVARI
jgi:hypothetical protein